MSASLPEQGAPSGARPFHERGERWSVVAGRMVHGGVCLGGLEDGTALLVDGAIPGERVTVELHHRKGRTWFARTVAVEQASEHRVAAPCPYYGECGGCQLQHVDYSHQRQLKLDIVRDAMRRQGVAQPGDVRLHGMDEPWHYRWRGDFHVVPGEDGVASARLGFNRLQSWKPVPIDDCLIHHRTITESLQPLVTLLREAASPEVRALHLTVGEDGDELLVSPRPRDSLPAAALDAHSFAASKRWSTTSTTLRWRDHTYRVSPATFIQVSWAHLDTLYGAAIDALGDVDGVTVVDAYAGVGVLACELASRAGSVVCIESNRESAAMGVHNVAVNGCSERVRYVAEPVELALPEAAAGAAAVLLDPPRAGCDRRVTAWLALAGPRRVVYVSCDPATLARDLRVLTVSGPYRVQALDVVDMFAQTHHVECVVGLERAS